MNTLYLDINSGLSGDMFLGALVALGVDAHRLEHELEKLALEGYHLHVTRGHKSSIEGVKVDVHLSHDHNHDHDHQHHSHTHAHSHGGHEHPHEHEAGHHHDHGHGHTHSHEHEHEHGRTFAQIKQLITASSLSDWVKQKSIAVFQRIAVAEGNVHGLPPEQVAFHEVGAVDSIVDIVGACIGLELLDKPRVLAGPVVEGTGWIDCAHGRFPIPAPATLAILGARGIPLSQCDEPHELVTPTGAALLAEFVETFAPMRGLVARKIGFGLGTRDNRTRPNVLRAILGEAAGSAASHDWETDTVTVLETNLDDINAEILGSFVDLALASGALDVFYTAIQMKKNRPAVLLTVLCAEADADKFSELILRETSAFGVRRYSAERRKLAREFMSVQTPYGEVTVKLGRLDQRVLQAAPEFESCKKAAAKSNVPLKQVYEAALKAVAQGTARSA
jgi:pyridinium-3,5-bisthiocarboxylic acid mononucleotide nickel chelatase